MAEAGPSGLPLGTYELKIGQSFAKSRKKVDYHTLRYDFKPKSIGGETETYVSINNNDDVQIAIASEGRDDITMYKGAKKPIKDGKECFLIFDESTGEMRLEKISSNINVKQTRRADDDADKLLREEVRKLRKTKGASKPIQPDPLPTTPSNRPPSPVKTSQPISQPISSPKKSEKPREKRPSESKKHNDSHMSSSSDSSDSSSDSSDSSDESENEENSKVSVEKSHRQRPESSNFSSDDEAALEKHLNASGPSSTNSSNPVNSSKSTPRDPPPTSIKSQQQVDQLFDDMDMPNLISNPQPQPTQKTQPVKKIEKHSQMLLQNDLDLSESSDED
ncbi:unnamed protein product [Bursaphelenchus xylophilus]|uniref:Ell-associated factor Eaf n=1 Tax=Bursaphelenchus xylophilus TaxID=6326 RepID=A0A1I7S1U7_BURXY|nr:unnamed protein product [Bursaphelenchus xylophilus]CAG9089961.1 unnamed protein product [Bursaphelenchus xylophilus]